MLQKYFILLFILIASVLLSSYINIGLVDVSRLLSGTFFIPSSTEESLKSTYEEARVIPQKAFNVLIVPGHEMGNGGAQYHEVYERDLTVEVAENLFKYFSYDPIITPTLLRTKTKYNDDFISYFNLNKEKIFWEITSKKELMKKLVDVGLVDTKVGIEHNVAPNDVALMLYGINVWANEKKFDVVVHIHFNDYPGRLYQIPGKYSGFAIYVPERQFSNSEGSKKLAETISERLFTYFAKSDLPLESAGIIEDQDLIAVGAFNTLDPASIFIEYGYVYESKFNNNDTRSLTMQELAFQTYSGIKDFFSSTEIPPRETSVKYTPLENNLNQGVNSSKDVFSLQMLLSKEGYYPPTGFSKNDCPVSGNFGYCTELSVINFQNKYGITPASGFVGPKTRYILNSLTSETW